MTWTKIDDTFWRHAKVAALLDRPGGRDAVCLWALALSWVGSELTDGMVPKRQPWRLLGDDPTAAVAALVDVGLWERVPDGWRLHDYLVYNPSRAKVLAERQRRHELAVAGGLAKATKVDAEGRREVTGEFPSRTAGQAAGTTAGQAAGENPAVRLAVSPAPSPVSRSPYSDTPEIPTPPPPSPPERGRRKDGSNARSLGSEPRSYGASPRQTGSAPRQVRQAEKVGGLVPLRRIMAGIQAHDERES